MKIKNKLVAGLAALVMAGVSCSHAPIKINGSKLRDTCFYLLFEAEKITIGNKDDKLMEKLLKREWCNDYSRIEEDIAELARYIVKQSG